MFQLISGVEVNDDDDREKENSFMESLSLTKRSKRVSDKETCMYFSPQ